MYRVGILYRSVFTLSMLRTLCIVSVFLLGAPSVFAQATLDAKVETIRADVVKILHEEVQPIVGTDAIETVQMVQVELLGGERAGDVVSFENDFIKVSEGDRLFINRQVTINGDELFMIKDVDRRWELLLLLIFFAGLLVYFAGRQGLRALGSLALSVGAIIFLLVPVLLAGYNPALASLGVAGVILAVVLFGTHGFKPHVAIAYGGTMAAVVFTCLLAWWWVASMRLSGFGSDASVYLNFATDGRLDFAGLLLGSIIIGILGVLDDVSITQASVVQELKAANASLGLKELYQRAIRVGKDHVGSLVNTLALAYVGISLPLVLFLSGSEAPVTHLLNQEIVASELVRILIGSIGLVLAVPFTTLLAAWWFSTHEVDEAPPVAPCGHRH